jgi:hypothetical protein
MPGLHVTSPPATSTQILPEGSLSTISRDCGFTVGLSNGAALWVFCDSTDQAVTGGPISYFINSSAALAYPDSPTVLRGPVDGSGRPLQLINPSDAPYAPCPAGYRHLAWPMSATRAGGGPGNDRVVIFYENVCQSLANFADGYGVSTGVAEWWHDTSRPIGDQVASLSRATIVQPNLFPRPGGLTTPWGVNAVDGRDGYLYLHRCATGSCSAARAPIGQFGTASAYRYWTGSTWTTSVPGGTGQVQFLAGGPHAASHLQWVAPLGAFVMATVDPATWRHTVIWAGPTPVGPWTAPTKVLIPGCDPSPVPPGGRFCYHGTVHDHLSSPGMLAIGIHDGLTDRNGTLRTNHRVAWLPVSTTGLAGNLEAVTTPKGKVSVVGWALDRNTTANVRVDVYAGNAGLGSVNASAFRQDIKNLFPDTSGNAGFSTTFDAPLGPQRICAYAIRTVGPGGNPQLGCRDVFVPDPLSPFLDVLSTDPFFTDIVWLKDQGITTGSADGTFRPGAPVQRMAMAAFLYRLAGSPAFTPPATSPFTDVTTGHPFYEEITWLAGTGITTGYPNLTFRPTAKVQRQAMAAFLYRLAGSPAFTPPATSPFTDVTTGHPFYEEITWLAGTGITTGYPDLTFRPGSAVQRQAMAAFLHRYGDAGLPILPPA